MVIETFVAGVVTSCRFFPSLLIHQRALIPVMTICKNNGSLFEMLDELIDYAGIMDHSQHVGPADGSHGITTSPADGDMLMGPPAEFSATFPHPMRLTRVTLQAEGQATTEITVPEASPSAAVSVALPDLAPATYTLAWTAQGSDGHEMSGTTEFMVH